MEEEHRGLQASLPLRRVLVFGRVRQLCRNANERGPDSRRNVLAGQSTSSCRQWPGLCVDISPTSTNVSAASRGVASQVADYKQFVRDMFYLADEQTEDACIRVLLAQSKRLQREFRKRKLRCPAMVGNHDCYEAELSKMLCKGQKPTTLYEAGMRQEQVDTATGLCRDDLEEDAAAFA